MLFITNKTVRSQRCELSNHFLLGIGESVNDLIYQGNVINGKFTSRNAIIVTHFSRQKNRLLGRIFRLAEKNVIITNEFQKIRIFRNNVK